MARLYYRDPTTEAMVALTLGSTSTGETNEVTISATAPTDDSELWMDTTAGKLKYRHPTTGVYTDVPIDLGSAGIDGTITAGAGLTGGGKQSTSPTLNVVGGSGISVTADAVAVNKGTLDTWYAPVNGQSGTTVTDWNSAVNNGTTYRASGAANAPDTGWFMGYCMSHDANYKVQILTPYANARWTTGGTLWMREKENNVWGDWNRLGIYSYSRDLLDAGTFVQHNGTGNSTGVRRCFYGMVKDKATNNASNSDAWRVTYYNTAGSYSGQAINIPLGTGVVSHPQGHSTTMSALRTRKPILADTAATVGVVMEIVAAALASAGIDINPTAVARLVEESTE